MLEKQLSAIIAQHLSKFLRNVSEEHLNLSLWAGEVALENLALQEDVFDQVSLLLWQSSSQGNLGVAASAEVASLLVPFTVVHGVVRRLKISIPWSTMETEPVSVEVEGISIVLGPLRQRPYNAEEEVRRQEAIKSVQLSAFETGAGATTSVAPAPKPPVASGSIGGDLASSFVDRLIATIIRNIHVTVRDVSVSYNFDYQGLHPSLATSVQMRVDEVVVVAVDEECRPRFISNTLVEQGRLVHVGGISVSVHTGRSPGGSGWESSVTLIEPFSSQVRTIDPAEDVSTSILATISASCTPIHCGFNLAAIRAFMSAISSFTGSLQHAAHRPFLGLLSNEALGSISRRRWLFAFAAVQRQCSAQKGLNRRRIETFLSVKSTYLGLHKRSKNVSWLPPLSASDKTQMELIEQGLTFDQIVFLRCLAQVELEEEGRHVEDDRRRRQTLNEKVQPKKPRGWGMWWGKNSDAPKPEAVEEEEQPSQNYYSSSEVRRRTVAALERELARFDERRHKQHLVDEPLLASEEGSPLDETAIAGPTTTKTVRGSIISVDVPKIELALTSGDVKLAVNLNNLSASLRLGEEGDSSTSLHHTHQFEIGSVDIAAIRDDASTQLLIIPQTTVPCLIIGSNASLSVVNCALGECFITLPEPSLLADIKALSIAAGALMVSSQAAPRPTNVKPVVSFSRELRLSVRRVSAATSLPNMATLTAELSAFSIACKMDSIQGASATLEFTADVDSSYLGSNSAPAGFRLALVGSEGSGPSQLLMVALELRAAFAPESVEVIGSLSGHIKWACLSELGAIVAVYRSAWGGAASLCEPSVTGPTPQMDSLPSPSIKFVLQSFAIVVADDSQGHEGCTINGIQPETDAQWLVLTVSPQQEMKLICAGIDVSPCHGNMTSTRIGTVSLELSKAALIIAVGGAYIVVAASLVRLLEVAMVILSFAAPTVPQALEPTAARASEAPSISLSFEAPIVLALPDAGRCELSSSSLSLTVSPNGDASLSTTIASLTFDAVPAIEAPIPIMLSSYPSEVGIREAGLTIVCDAPIQYTHYHARIMALAQWAQGPLMGRLSALSTIGGLQGVGETSTLMYVSSRTGDGGPSPKLDVRVQSIFISLPTIGVSDADLSEGTSLLVTDIQVSSDVVNSDSSPLSVPEMNISMGGVQIDSVSVLRGVHLCLLTNVRPFEENDIPFAIESKPTGIPLGYCGGSSVAFLQIASVCDISFSSLQYRRLAVAVFSNVLAPPPRVAGPSSSIESSEHVSTMPFAFVTNIRQNINLRVGTDDGTGSVAVLIEGVTMQYSVGDIGASMAVEVGVIRVCDNTNRILPPNPYTPVDEGTDSQLRLPDNMPMISMSTISVSSKGTEMQVLVDNFFLTGLFESLRTVKDILLPDCCTPYLSERSRQSTPVATATKQLQPSLTYLTKVSIRNTSIYLYEEWLESVGSLMVPEVGLSVTILPDLSSEISVVLPQGVALNADSASGPVELVRLSQLPAIIELAVRAPANMFSSVNEPRQVNTVSLSVSNLHIIAHPAVLKVANACISQLVPLSELAYTPTARSKYRWQPVIALPSLQIAIKDTSIEVLQSLTGQFKPLKLVITEASATNQLVPTVRGAHRLWSDVLTVNVGRFKMTPDIFSGGDKALTATVNRPLPTSTAVIATGMWAKLDAIQTLEFSSHIEIKVQGLIRIGRSALLSLLRVSQLFAPPMPVISTIPKTTTDPILNIVPTLSVSAGTTRIDFIDEPTRESLISLVLPELCSVVISTSTQLITVRASGQLTIRDSSGASLVEGNQTQIELTVHPEKGISGVVGGLTAILDLKRANSLLRVIDVGNELQSELLALLPPSTPSANQVIPTGHTEIHTALEHQQQALNSASAPISLAFHNVGVEFGHIARVGVSKAAVTINASAVTSTVLIEELIMEDCRAQNARRIVSVHHVNISSVVGDLKIKVHAATVVNNAIFFTDLATALLHTYRSILPKMKIAPKRDDKFRQSLLIDLSSFQLLFGTVSEQHGSDIVDITFPGLVVHSTQTTDTTSLSVEAVDGSFGFKSSQARRHPMCENLRFKFDLSLSPTNDATKLFLGNVLFSAPLGSSLRAIVTVLAENLAPYAVWVKLLTSPTALAHTTTIGEPSTKSVTLAIELSSVAINLYEPSTDSTNRTQSDCTVVGVNVSRLTLLSHASPDGEGLELRIGSITSSTDRSIQPDFISAVPSHNATDRDSTSTFGIYLHSKTTFDLAGSRSNVVARWGSFGLVLSPQLIKLLDDNVLRPAALGIRETSDKRTQYIHNESFTSISSHEGVLGGIMRITSNHVFTSDVIIGGADGVRLHIARTDNSPNVIELSGDVAVHLCVSAVRPIVVDEGISVYCKGLKFTTEPSYPLVFDYIHCGPRSFFNIPMDHLSIRDEKSITSPKTPAYSTLSAGLRLQRQHISTLSVKGHLHWILCNNKDTFGISSEVEAEYAVTKNGNMIVEEKGFFGLPTLSVQCNEGSISKNPITMLTHLEHHPSREDQPAITNVHVILDAITIILTLEHAKLLFDTVQSIGPLVARAGKLGSDIDVMTASTDPFTANAAESPPVPASPLSPLHKGQKEESPRLNIVINMPSFRLEFVDSPSMRLIGWGSLSELALQVLGTRDFRSMVVKGSCSIGAADIPYAYGGERMLLDVNPEIVADLSSLDAGGSMCEVAIAIPPMRVTLPLIKLLAAASYEFQAPVRGPYTIVNETDIAVRVEIGSQSVEVDESSEAHAPIDGRAKVRLVLPEHSVPILLDLTLAHSTYKLPFLSTSANMLSVWVNHSLRTIRFTTGIVVLSKLSGVSDPLLTLRWGDAFGSPKNLECPPDTAVVLPFAVASKILCFHKDGVATGTEILPIDILCGMARAAALSGGPSIQFRMPLDEKNTVIVRASTVKSNTVTAVPDVVFEVYPILTLVNASRFSVSIATDQEHILKPQQCLNWFSDDSITSTISILLENGSLISKSTVLRQKADTRIVFGDEHHEVHAILHAISDPAFPSSQTLSFSTGTRIYNQTAFPLELYGKHPSTGKEVPIAGKGVGVGLLPQSSYPLGHPKADGPEYIRIRPSLPHTSLSGTIAVGATALSLGSISCVQEDQVHIFSVSEKDDEISIAPMWSCVNKASIPARVVCGSIEVTVLPQEQVGLTTFPVKESADPAVYFEFEGYRKSAPFHLATASQKSTTNTHRAILLSQSGRPACLTLSIDRSSQGLITVAATLSTTHFPFEIENRTLCELHVQQRGQTRQMKLKPFESASFAFDTLTGEPRAIAMEMIGPHSQRRYSHIIDPDLLPAPTEGWEITKGLYMTALVTPQKVYFSLVPDRLLHSTYVFRPRFITNISLFVASMKATVAAPVGHTYRTVFAELADESHLGETAKQDPATFLTKREFELLTILLDDLSLSLTDNGRHRMLNVGIGSVEVLDVTWRDAKHPCVIACARKSPREPWARIALHESTSDNATIETRHIVALSALFSSISVKINDRLLFTLMAAANELTKHTKRSTVQLSAAPPPMGPPSRLKVDKIFISSIPIVLTYSRRSDAKYDAFGQLAVRHLLTSIEAAPLVLSSVSATEYCVTTPAGGSTLTEMVMQLLVPVYRSNALLQSYKLIGSLEVLGNPVMFSSTVGEGVQEFIRLSLAMHPVEGMTHLLSSTGSGLLHTCALFSRVGGKLVGAASFDNGWLSECDSNGRRNQSLLTGLSQGASGVVMRPFNGARTGGFVGALTGLLTGATGAIAKPLSGALFSVANVSEGAAEALRRSRKGIEALEDDITQDCNNVTTVNAWVTAESTSSVTTPSETKRVDKKTKGVDIYAKQGPKQAAMAMSWNEFMAASTEADFTSWAHIARDHHLLQRVKTAQSKRELTTPKLKEVADPLGAASAERAAHLKSTLGVSGMLKYVTLDQFVKCVSWDDAKNAVPAEDFKKKVAPMMLRELEKSLDSMCWV